MTLQQNGVTLTATGERCMTDIGTPWAIEHLHRYALAKEACADKEVLDIASGEGYGSALLAGVAASVVGVDLSPEAVRHASNKYRYENLRFEVGKAEAIPLPDRAVDVVVSFETLEHVADHETMFLELKRVLKTDGVLIISTPDRQNYPDLRFVEAKEDANPFHVKELDSSEFRKIVSNHFRHSRFFGQRLVSGSLLIPDEATTEFRSYEGDFRRIAGVNGVSEPIYRLCYASDRPVENLAASFFDGWNTLIELPKQKLQKVETSAQYRVGRYITYPARRLMRFFTAKAAPPVSESLIHF